VSSSLRNRREEEIKKATRRSIVASTDIPQGSIITEDMFDIKRPGNGIEPKYIDKIIGAIVKVDINRDDRLTWSKIEVKS
jgi:sialic acid synthase SpsE